MGRMKAQPTVPTPGHPITLRLGHPGSTGTVSLKAYCGTNKVNGKEYPVYTLVYGRGTHRKRERVNRWTRAQATARGALQGFANGGFSMVRASEAAPRG